MQSLGTKMAAKAVEKSVKKELKSALPPVPSGPRRRSKILTVRLNLKIAAQQRNRGPYNLENVCARKSQNLALCRVDKIFWTQ